MRRIERGVAAIISDIGDGLTFYNLSIAKRSVMPAIFHLSTISLICLFLITTMSPSLFLTDSSISTIYGQQSLTVRISSNDTEGVVPATFDFQADIIGGTRPYTISWDLGDGTEGSNEQTIEHTFEEAGTYNVTLAVTDIDDHNESDSIVITVKEPPPPPPPPNGWIILLVVLASIVIGGIALGKYKMNQRRSRRIRIPPSAIVEITAKGGIDQ